jgi:hypothetical protein
VNIDGDQLKTWWVSGMLSVRRDYHTGGATIRDSLLLLDKAEAFLS